MKKFLVIIMSLMMTFALAACGGGGGTSDSSPSESADGGSAGKDTAQFQEIVLFDNEYATMKVVDYDPNGDWGYELKVYLENKSDKTLMFAVDSASINGYMIDPFWASEVNAGKKENTAISWYTSDLEENGIAPDAVEEIEMSIHVYDSDDWSADYIIDDTYTIVIPH